MTVGWISPGATSAKISRRTSSGNIRTVQKEAVARIMVTQPTDGLAVERVSMTLAAVTGSAAMPPCSRPISRWKKPAEASRSASQSGTRRASSTSSAAARISGSMAWAVTSRSRGVAIVACALTVLISTSRLAIVTGPGGDAAR